MEGPSEGGNRSKGERETRRTVDGYTCEHEETKVDRFGSNEVALGSLLTYREGDEAGGQGGLLDVAPEVDPARRLGAQGRWFYDDRSAANLNDKITLK